MQQLSTLLDANLMCIPLVLLASLSRAANKNLRNGRRTFLSDPRNLMRDAGYLAASRVSNSATAKECQAKYSVGIDAGRLPEVRKTACRATSISQGEKSGMRCQLTSRVGAKSTHLH